MCSKLRVPSPGGIGMLLMMRMIDAHDMCYMIRALNDIMIYIYMTCALNDISLRAHVM